MASGIDKEEKKKGKSFFSRFSFRKKNGKKKDKIESLEEEGASVLKPAEKSVFSRIRQSFSKKKKKTVVEDEGRHSQSELVVSGDKMSEFSGGPRRPDKLEGCALKNSRPTTKTSKPLPYKSETSSLNPPENVELVTQPSENLNANTASCTLECHQPSSITQDTCQSENDELPSSFSSIPAEPVGSSASPTTASICTGNNQSKPSMNKELPQSFSSVPAVPVPDGTLPTTQSQISSKKGSKEQMIEDQLLTSISAGKSQSKQEQPSQSLTNDSNNTLLKSIQPTTQSQMPADDLSTDATGMPSTSTPTEQLPQNKTQKSSVPAPESETSSETSSESSPEIGRGKKKSTNKNRNTHIQFIKAKKVQTGDRSIMNVHDYRGGGKIPTIGKVKKNKDEKKKSKTLIQHIDAKELQTGSNAVMSVTLYPKNTDATVYTSGAGDEAASNRCKEFLRTDGQGAFTKPQLQAMLEVLKSVGYINFPGVSGMHRGTAFLVGSSGHYIFTAWHIVRDIISVNQLGAPNSHDLNRLNSDDVYVDFSDDRSPMAHKYLLKPVIIYYDDNLDVALLQLQETTGHGNNVIFPQTLRKFSPMENVTEVAILGHGNPDGSHGVIADTKCEVIRDGSSLLQEAIHWFDSEGGRNIVRSLLQQSRQIFTTEELRSPYDKVTNGNSIVCNSYITKGASGSPMVTMLGTVVGVYTCGIPGSFWRINSDLRSGFPERFVFGCGATMVAIYNSMQDFMVYGTGQLTENIMQDIFYQQ